ncbi:MAG: NAD(P)H-dependent glycerol-3-phosphate dehydrogenase [bacterium]
MAEAAENVAVIGGGSWGTALAQLAAEAGRDVLLWMRDEAKADAVNTSHRNKTYWPKHRLSENIRATADLAEAAGFARYMLIALPSQCFREVVGALGEHVGGDHVLVHGTKGLESGTCRRMSEILREETPVKRLGALSGPNLAAEIMEKNPAAAVVASRYPEVVFRTQAALSSERFRVYGNRDIAGVELAGSLKNVMAIFAGIADGLGLGHNTLAMVMTRGAEEIRRFGVAMGAEDETFAGLSGIGDLIATCSSEMSVNRQVGFRLSRGEKLEDILKSLNRVAEGVRTTRTVLEMAGRKGVEMPIIWAVNAVLYEDADPADINHMLMTRRSKYEKDRYYNK